MKFNIRGVGAGYRDVQIIEGATSIDLGLQTQTECAELAAKLRDAADELRPQPARNEELIDALDEALDVIATLSGKDNSCDEPYCVADLVAVLSRAKAAA